MRSHRTVLALLALLLVCASPTWARNGDSNSRPNDSKNSDSDSRKGSRSGESAGKGSGGEGSGGGGKSERSGNKANRDGAKHGKGHAREDNDRKWPDSARPGRDREGDPRRRCPNGRRDCRDNCCNRFGYGQSWPGWDPIYDGWGFPWPDYPNPGRVDRDVDQIRGSSKNVELRISPVDVEVYVNGVRHSKRGNTKISLASGFWTIEIRAEGYLTEVLELEIKQGDRYTIERKLRRDPNYRPSTREQRTSKL